MDEELASTGLVVLAAGFGSRFDSSTHKLLENLNGRPIVSWVLEAAASVEAGAHFVVTQDSNLSSLLPAKFIELRNPSPQDGLASSLALAVDAASAMGLWAVTVGLGDQPLVPPEAWNAVTSTKTGGVAIATYAGVRGNPVKIASSVFGLLERRGDVGARAIFHRVEAVEVPCSGDPFDVDTREDLEQLRAIERN
ncbi:nucleotidyltransferase family protein [Ferrimicrobium acidiphilum]|jgi:CTP:molybdopterin cytidylyltransferase MocA|uniref:nucleotidyltransferase family protein n=1 Tax=Ferrimicrobium acidiphilum TaxID=121039 RepID=UPI0023F3ED36|nr:nucleotidyltransferase family protein [Ferrimicrobium acidiphilum]